MSGLEVTADHLVPIGLQGAPTTVTVTSGSTLNYSASSSKTVEGTITVGSSYTFSAPAWVWSTGLSEITVQSTFPGPVPASQLPATLVNAMSGSQTVLPTYVYQASGSDDAAGILAVFNAMKVSGHATGTLKLLGNIVLNETLTLDGGYASIGYAPGGAGEQFTLDMSGAAITPAANIGVALAVQGFYGARVDARFNGGGNLRSVTDGAISSSSNTTTLTSATAAFTSADVGKFVRVEGAGLSGVGPLCARISTVTNGTTVVVDSPALTTVSSAKVQIMDIALQLENLLYANVACYAQQFAGLAFHVDCTSVAKGVQQSTIREIKTDTCGQGIFVRGGQGNFGAIQDTWIDTDVNGSVFDGCADIVIPDITGYSPTTQTDAILFTNCTDMEIGKMSMGDRPSGAMVKIVGNNNDFGTIGECYLTGYRPGANPTINGLKIIDVASVVVQTLRTHNMAKGLWVQGTSSDGSVEVLEHSSEGNDGNPLYVEAGVQNTTANVNVRARYRNCQLEAAYIASSVTAGETKLRGIIQTPNNLANGAIYGINCQATAATLDVSGLVAPTRATLAGAINHVTPDNIRGVGRARLGNSLTHGAATPTTITPPSSGTAVQNNSDRTQTIYVTMKLTDTLADATNAEYEVNLASLSANLGSTTRIFDGYIQALQTGTGNTLLITKEVTFRVPPYWWWSIVLDHAAVINTVRAYYE